MSDAAFRFPGGAVEFGGAGVALRWCLYSPFGGPDDDQAACAKLARRAPLPPERLWFAGCCLRGYALPPWLPDAARRGELEAEGRLQYTSDVDVVVKATSVDDGAYARSKARVAALARARADLRDRHAAVGTAGDRRAALAALAAAQAAYHAAKSALVATDALAVYARGRAERRTRRALGLLDESKARAYARLRVLWIGARDPASRLSCLPEDVLAGVLMALL